jgi:hypothetical protein
MKFGGTKNFPTNLVIVSISLCWVAAAVSGMIKKVDPQPIKKKNGDTSTTFITA